MFSQVSYTDRHIWCCRLAHPSVVVSMTGKVLFVESWAVRVQRDLELIQMPVKVQSMAQAAGHHLEAY